MGMANTTTPAAQRFNIGVRAHYAICIAEGHAHKAEMRSSADLCIADAKACAVRGDYAAAAKRAAESMAYSVGVFHPDYADAMEAARAIVEQLAA